MNWDEFMNSLKKETGIRSYVLFETLVLKLLSKYLGDQSKDFLMGVPQKFDGLAPDGIDDLPGPTVVEIKLYQHRIRIPRHALIHICERITESENVKSLLLIFGSRVPLEEKDRCKSLITKNYNLKTEIWDIDNLSTIANRYPEFMNDIIPKISRLVINNVVSSSLKKSPSDWEKTRESLIESIKDVYRRDDLVLFLGAGISKDEGVPNWNTLLSDLLVEMISKKLEENDIRMNNGEKQAILEELSESRNSLLIQSRYIKKGLEELFEKSISEVLYRKVKKEIFNTDKLIHAIARLCLPRRGGVGIKSIVTYNFDDLLEKEFERMGIKYRSIYRETDIPSQEELGIYHVHGFLPREPKNYEGLSESLLVFSEESYHKLLLDPYHWSNMIQLTYLRENTCLMFGMSITDPNLRRLLDVAARKIENPKHYAVLKKRSFPELSKSRKDIRKHVIRSFLAVDQDLIGKSFQELGLNILWIKDYSEIPQILETIRD